MNEPNGSDGNLTYSLRMGGREEEITKLSHLSQIETAMRSLPVLRAALKAIGVPVLENVKRVSSYYNPAGVPVELAFGVSDGYCMGAERTDKGTLSVVGDCWKLEEFGGASYLEAMGYGKNREGKHYRSECHPRGEIHYPIGGPGRLLQEYTLQTCQLLAKHKGQSVRRIAGQGGRIDLIITGGNLPPGKSIQVWTTNKGECSIRPIGLPSPACHRATKPYEDALGVVTHSQECREAMEMGAVPTIQMRSR